VGVLLLTLLLLGGGGLWWQHRQGVELTRAVEDDFNALAREQAQPRPDWNKAESILERIEGRLGKGGPETLRRRVQAERQELEQVRRNQEMVTKLEEARLQWAALAEGEFDHAGSRKQFEEAFARYGLDVWQGSANEVAARIADSPIREELVIALDTWAYLIPTLGAAKVAAPGAVRLLAVANLADANAWRQQVREAAQKEDYDRVRQLADEAKDADLPPASRISLVLALREGNTPEERIVPLLLEGRRRHPSDFWLNFELAQSLAHASPPQLVEAVRYYTVAQALRPNSAAVLNNLGAALKAKGDLNEAIETYHEAIRLNPDFGVAHQNLARALKDKGDLPGAVAEYQEALRCNPDDVKAYFGLGFVLAKLGKLNEAINAFRENVARRQDHAEGYYNLGLALRQRGDVDEAIAAYEKAVRYNKDFAKAHNNLGYLLFINKGDVDRAITHFKEAIRSDVSLAEPHKNLGDALRSLGNAEAAIAYYEKAIHLKKDYREAHNGLALARKLKQVLDRLSAVLEGTSQPKDANELLTFAAFCQEPFRRQYASAVRLYAMAFAAEPRLAGDAPSDRRYNAACAAAQAGGGEGRDAKNLPDKVLLGLRRQALVWLRADLAAHRRLLEKDAEKAGPKVREAMQHWQSDTDFAGVRAETALARLPESERPDWQKLWEEVEALRQRAAAPPSSTDKSPSK
jgi:tetratricopeptide (TPR) repeat protein